MCLFPISYTSDYVLLKYDDGLYQIRPLAELTEEYLTKRHSYSSDLIGKEILEKGMRVRAEWNTEFRISKAIIVAVDAEL